MAQPTRTVRVVVELTLAEASVLARAAVVVTSALECKEVNAADRGLLAFRSAVVLAVSKDVGREVVDRPDVTARPSLRAS